MAFAPPDLSCSFPLPLPFSPSPAPIELLPPSLLSHILLLSAASAPSPPPPLLRPLLRLSLVSRSFLAAVQSVPSLRLDDTELFDADADVISDVITSSSSSSSSTSPSRGDVIIDDNADVCMEFDMAVGGGGSDEIDADVNVNRNGNAHDDGCNDFFRSGMSMSMGMQAVRLERILRLMRDNLIDVEMAIGACKSPVAIPLLATYAGESLKSLRLLLRNDCNLSCKQWQAIAQFSSLPSLSVRAMWDGKLLADYGDIDACSPLYSLKRLHLENVRVGDWTLKALLKLCPHLTRFEYRHSLSIQQLRNPKIEGLGFLEELLFLHKNPYMSTSSRSSFWMDSVTVSAPNLRKLVVHRAGGLRIVGEMGRLKELHLISNGPMQVEVEQKFCDLEVLRLSYYFIPKEVRCGLLWGNLGTLRQLSLHLLFNRSSSSSIFEGGDDGISKDKLPILVNLRELELLFWEPDTSPVEFAVMISGKCPVLEKITIGFKDFTQASFSSKMWREAIHHFYKCARNSTLLRYYCSSYLGPGGACRWNRYDLRTYFGACSFFEEMGEREREREREGESGMEEEMVG